MLAKQILGRPDQQHCTHSLMDTVNKQNQSTPIESCLDHNETEINDSTYSSWHETTGQSPMGILLNQNFQAT